MSAVLVAETVVSLSLPKFMELVRTLNRCSNMRTMLKVATSQTGICFQRADQLINYLDEKAETMSEEEQMETVTFILSLLDKAEDVGDRMIRQSRKL